MKKLLPRKQKVFRKLISRDAGIESERGKIDVGM